MTVLEPTTATEEATARLVRTLALTTFLLWTGASSILPLLPEYLRRHGGSDATVGAVMSSYFVASLFLQYPAGFFADRFGRRPVLLLGLLIYAIGSAAFLAPVAPSIDIAFRALQGIGAGAFEVASLAVISGSVVLSRRGRAFSAIYGCQLAGMAIGPLVGSIIGVGSMNVMFIGAAVAALLASVPALKGTAIASNDAERRLRHRRDEVRGLPRLNRAIVGALLTAASIGLVIGVYESSWTLLFDSRHAHDWQIGLSWTLFALPFAAMSRPGGRLADRFDRRLLVLGSLALSISLCATYPFLHSLSLLIGLGALESIGLATALPAVQSLLTQSSSEVEVGRVQGLFSTTETAAIAVSAGAGGALFGLAVFAPFVAGASAAAVFALLCACAWQGVTGRASRLAGDLASATRDATVPPIIQ